MSYTLDPVIPSPAKNLPPLLIDNSFWDDYENTDISVFSRNFSKFKLHLESNPEDFDIIKKKCRETITQLVKTIVDKSKISRRPKRKENIYRVYVTDDEKNRAKNYHDDTYVCFVLERIDHHFLMQIGCGILAKCNCNYYLFKHTEDSYYETFSWFLNMPVNEGNKENFKEHLMKEFNLKEFYIWPEAEGMTITIKPNLAPRGSLGYFESEKGELSISKDKWLVKKEISFVNLQKNLPGKSLAYPFLAIVAFNLATLISPVYFISFFIFTFASFVELILQIYKSKKTIEAE